MLKQTRIILSLATITALLSGITLLSLPGCTSEQIDNTSEPEENPKLSSILNRLVLAEEQGEAEEFARQRGIELIDGGVTVIIHCVPGQCEATAEAATRASAREVQTREIDNLVRAVAVPITSLVALANDASISSIRLPVYGVEED